MPCLDELYLFLALRIHSELETKSGDLDYLISDFLQLFSYEPHAHARSGNLQKFTLYP